MKSKFFKLLVLSMIVSFTLGISINLLADNPPKVKNKAVEGAPPIDEAKLAKPSITHHSATINNKVISYQATTGYMLMKDESGKHLASIFYVAYTKEKTNDVKTRPITFAFNGGPGSASLWLHMGALGPKRVKMSDEGFQLPQPFEYEDNEYSWLEFTDLVFIDPVSTGYSRPAPGIDKRQFHGVEEDVRSVGEFIRLYVTRNNRWLSPKFVCGESYGTTRAAGLSGYLQKAYGMYLQGVVLISSILNFHTARFAPGNDLPYPLFLPTYTAGAWYHKKLPEKYQKDLHATLKEVEQWALTDYWLALAKGDTLTETERNRVIDQLAQYTGLSKKYIDNANLRIEIHRFTNELLRDEKQKIGRLDNRFKGNLLDASGGVFQDDPSYLAIYGSYTAAANDYIRQQLKYTCDLLYRPIARQVRPWNWGETNGYVNVAEVLRQAINENNNLKVMIANGYHDLATPYFATRYTINHINLAKSLRNNIEMKYYEAGHMMYINKTCLAKLKQDAYEFYTGIVK